MPDPNPSPSARRWIEVHDLTVVPIGFFSALGSCSCGWHSKACNADAIGPILRDWDQHKVGPTP